MSDAYDGAVRAWAAHLRGGGRDPWADFVARGPSPVAGEGPTPTAPQLELLRRLGARGPVPRRLADLVLATAPPGRGPVDVPLPWPGHRFGSPAVDPALLPEREVLRQAVGVLAGVLAGQAPPTTTRPRRARPWRRRVAVLGAPLTAAATSSSLRAAGVPASYGDRDRRATHVVVLRPLDDLAAEQWADRVAHGGILTWAGLWERAQLADRLPVEPIRLAERLHADGVPVHVVLDRRADGLQRRLAEVLRRPAVDAPTDVAPAAVDLARRVVRPLALEVGRDRARGHLGGLIGLVGPTWRSQPADGSAVAVGVPEAQRAWAEDHADRLAARLRRADYPVHGDPADLRPDPARPGAVDVAATLTLALDALWTPYEREVRA